MNRHTTESRFALPRGVIVLLGAGAAVLVVAGMQQTASLLGPVFLALMVTVAVSPLSRRVRSRGAPVWVGIAVAVLAVNVILLFLVVSATISVSQLADLLPSYEGRFDQLIADVAAALDRVGFDPDQVQTVIGRIDPDEVLSLAAGVIGGVAGVLSNAFFLLALLLFMAVDAASFPSRLDAAARQRPQVVAALRSFARGTRRYLLVSTVFGLIVAVIDALVLWPLGVPLPFLWGLLSFITNYIPNIGFVVGLVPPALLGLLEGGPGLMVTVIVLYSVANVVIQSIIQPKFVGDAVGLSVTVSFLSLVFWTWVIGPLGALLAIPLTLMVKSLLVDADPTSRWVGLLMSGERVGQVAAAVQPGRAERQKPGVSR